MSEFQTALRIFLESGADLAIPYDSSFGVEQTISPVPEAGSVKVDVNGNAIALKATQHQKFLTSINVRDMGVPAIADLWTGDKIKIHSITDLTQTVPASGSVQLIRDPVAGSVQCYNAAGAKVSHTRSGRNVTAAGAKYVRYAPILDILVTEYDWSTNETTADSSWFLAGREV